MKPLSLESNFLGIGVSATQIGGATVVRLFNTSASTGTVQVLENDAENNYWGPVVGSITIPAGEVVYIQKKSEEWLSGDSVVNYTQVAYSHMMSFTSYASSGGGGGIVTQNLVLNLDAGDNSSYGGSGTTWTDLSGQGNNGTLVNGVAYSSDNSGYLIFDGNDDKVTLPVGSDFAYGTGDFTVEMWFNVTGTSPQQYGERLFCQTQGGTNYFVISASRGSPVVKKPVFTYGASGTGTHIVSSTAYTEGTWHHLIITRNGTTATLYLDNSSVATATVSLDFNNTTYVPTIGAFTHSDSLNLDGKISIVRVYKGKGFSSSDVTQNRDAVKSRYGY